MKRPFSVRFVGQDIMLLLKVQLEKGERFFALIDG